MVLVAILLLLANQGFSHSANIELKANVGKCLIVGETLELTCTINNWDEVYDPDLQQLQLRHTNGRRMVDVNTSMVDNRTVQAIVSTIGIGDSGKYECHYKPDIHMYMSLIFNVTEPDPMPEDLECMSNGATTKVNCTWDSRDLCATWRFFYSKSDDYEAECVLPVHNVPKGCVGHHIDSNTNGRKRCRLPPPKGESLHLECIMDHFQAEYTLRLERRNSFGNQTQIVMKKFGDTIVKLDPVQNLKVHRTSTTMSLGWKFVKRPKYYYNGICCTVTCGAETKSLIFPHHDTNLEVTEILFSELHPFTQYTITVVCQVNGSRYWGDPVEQTFTTEEEVPAVGPSTTDHSYTSAKCISDNTGTCLTIHIKEVDALEAHGNISGYAVEIRSSYRTDVKQGFNFSNTLTTLEIGALDIGIIPPFHVSIWSKTSKGLSNRSTDIVINPIKDTIDEVILEEGDAYYLVTAELLTGSAPSQHIFHWCYGVKTDSKTVTCKDGYGYRHTSKPELWIEKAKLDGSVVIVENGGNDRWHFGMSVTTETGSSGIHWNDCTFGSDTHGRSPRQPERPLLSDGIHNQIVVDVQSFCPQVASIGQRFRPMNYTVVYVHNNDDHGERTKTFEARYKRNGHLELNNLTPGSTYSVKYNIGYRQRTSPYSEPGSKYISAQPQTELIVGIAVGITFIFLLGIIVIWQVVRWYKEIEQPIEGVEIDSNTKDTLKVEPKSCSDDSGIESHNGKNIKQNMVIGNKTGDVPFHRSSKFLGNIYSKDKSLSGHGSDINSSYKIISSLSNGGGLNVNFADADRSESSENIGTLDYEMCFNQTIALEESPGIADEQNIDLITRCCHSTLISDANRDIPGMRHEQPSVGENNVRSQSITTSNGFQETEVDVGTNQDSSPFAEYMSMNGDCQRPPDVTLDEHDLAAILLSANANEEINDSDDECPQHIDDFLPIPTDSLPFIDENAPDRFTKSVGKVDLRGKKQDSRYKQLLQKEADNLEIQNKSLVLPKTNELDDEQPPVEDNIEQYVPPVSSADIDELGTRRLDTILQPDNWPGVSENQISVLEKMLEPPVSDIGKLKTPKSHYKTLPVSNDRL